MKDSLYLAWRYLRHHRVKTLLLVLSLTVFLALPLVMRSMSRAMQRSFLTRAESTPLLLGQKGSSLDLVIEALYFEAKGVEPVKRADVDAIHSTGLGTAIPLRTGLFAQGFPLVGTSLAYFDLPWHLVAIILVTWLVVERQLAGGPAMNPLPANRIEKLREASV